MREVRRALKEGAILVDGRRRAPGDRARGGEEIDVEHFIMRTAAVIEPDGEALARAPILFESQHLLALSKPSGMQTAPLRPQERGTLLSAAIAHTPQIREAGPPLEGGLVHRLDRDTSGVVLFAKDLATREELRAAFAGHQIEKRYLALAKDPGLKDRFQVQAWITQAKDRVRLAEPGEEGALYASTDFRVLERFDGYAWLEAITYTGRRHQIRAHLASQGASLAGDPLYGDASSAPRLALHAAKLILADGRAIEATLPTDLRTHLEALRR